MVASAHHFDIRGLNMAETLYLMPYFVLFMDKHEPFSVGSHMLSGTAENLVHLLDEWQDNLKKRGVDTKENDPWLAFPENNRGVEVIRNFEIMSLDCRSKMERAKPDNWYPVPETYTAGQLTGKEQEEYCVQLRFLPTEETFYAENSPWVMSDFIVKGKVADIVSALGEWQKMLLEQDDPSQTYEVGLAQFLDTRGLIVLRNFRTCSLDAQLPEGCEAKVGGVVEFLP